MSKINHIERENLNLKIQIENMRYYIDTLLKENEELRKDRKDAVQNNG